MDIEQIEQLMILMKAHHMHRVEWQEGDTCLVLEHGVATAAIAPSPAVVAPPTVVPPKEEATESRYITSPMVGTFYPSPSPTDAPFIKVGQQVAADSIVCIIEAMKVMNEIKAGASGVITEILVKGGDPVEFGTKLFRIV